MSSKEHNSTSRELSEPPRRQPRQRVFIFVALLFEAFMLILFGIFVNYNDDREGKMVVETTGNDHNSSTNPDPDNDIDTFYPEFQDIHVMMFIGFGFLMTFLKRYTYSSVGVNFVLGAFILQWGTLVNGFFELAPDGFEGKVVVDIQKLIRADFAAAAVMITFGAVLGKVSQTQLLIIGFFEVIFYGINEMVGASYLKAVDVGGSMLIHTFGAYFGLAVAFTMDKKTARNPGSKNEDSVYHSDIFAMIGTIFLWLFWPSFNGGLVTGSIRHRAIVNTYYSLSACVVSTFIFSSLVDDKKKFSMTHVQNATLAGGVAIGNVADLMIQPWGAMFVGIIAGCVSVLGYKYVQPFVTKQFRIHDTCGVHNLHGLPGVFGAIVGIITVAVVSDSEYGGNLYNIFGARGEEGRSAGNQALHQFATLIVTLGFAVLGGIITGYIANLNIFDPVDDDETVLFDDSRLWDPSEELTFDFRERVLEILRNSTHRVDLRNTESCV